LGERLAAQLAFVLALLRVEQFVHPQRLLPLERRTANVASEGSQIGVRYSMDIEVMEAIEGLAANAAFGRPFARVATHVGR